MLGITINVSMQHECYEIDISGTATEFARLPACLLKAPTNTFALENKTSPYFPVALRQVLLQVVDESQGLLTAQISDAKLKLSGDALAVQRLNGFLSSLQNLRPGEHFHLDLFGNEDWLSPATSAMSFIFSIEASC
jgi:hypothetical protein